MSFASLVEPLRQVALFQGLEPIQLSEIAKRAERVVFRPGEAIISEGRAGGAAYLIVSGKAVRTAGPGAEPTSEPLSTGTVVGEMAMLVETRYSSTVVCEEPIKALKITRDSLHEQMRSDLALTDHLLDKLSSRLRLLADDLRKIDETLAAGTQFSPSAAASEATFALQPRACEATH
ncbi:MAG: cyclic nucleotide-binding domain-containing protein [Hyphomicrobiaceae bacterium]|nr:cyclic nucleotide-binding domain-containing protein [Hyphomicrobiaceae bacterium]